ncbi:MAG: ABC transporter substrate-binding protein [Flavobacteriaceae bacterium]|nr:ABC transporter substrate-binding protein [Flavobacteriaceae bacterium]
MIDLRIGGVPEHFNYPWYLTLKAKKHQQSGINLRWIDFDGGTGAMIEALTNKTIDLGVVLTEGVVKAIAEGAPLKIIQVYVASPLVWGVHVAATSDLHTAGDLRGKIAAISRYGSGSHLMSYVYGQNNQWNTNRDLSFLEIGDLNKGISSLTQGTSDYFLWERFTTKPFVDQGLVRCIDLCPTPWPCFVIAVHQDFLANHPEHLESILTTINTETKIFKERPGLIQALSLRYGQDPDDLRRWLEDTQWSCSGLTEKALNAVQEELVNLELISEKLPHTLFLEKNI